jgi:DNA polymerase I-like protein with 3'-5' exonuclease and polymerase domains
MDNLKDAAYNAAGKHFQINSVPQLSQILYENLKLDQIASIKVKATLARGAKSTSTPVVSNSSSTLRVSSTVI